MKLKSIIVLFFAAIVFAATAQTFNTQLSFSEKIHNFGKIKESDGKVSCRFRVTNKGKTPVTIVSARGGCSCVKSEVPKRPIAPGKSDYITVTFDPEYRPGHFSKEIVVMSSDKKYNRIWVKGDVVPGRHDISKNLPYSYGSDLYGNYKRMLFAARAGQWQSMKLRLGNNGSKPVTVQFRTAAKGFVVVVAKSVTIRPGEEASVDVRVYAEKASVSNYAGSLTPVIGARSLTPIQLAVNVGR